MDRAACMSSKSHDGEDSPASTDLAIDRELARNLTVERYKFIQQQIHSLNENVYRFLAIYQTIATVVSSAGIGLFVGYRKWGISSSVAQAGVKGLLVLLTVVAAYTVLLILVGVFAWLDYRREENVLTERLVGSEFRLPPTSRNLFRWYETYIVLFILSSIAVLWFLAGVLVLPNMN